MTVRLDPFQRIINVGWRSRVSPIFIINIRGDAFSSITAETPQSPPALPPVELLLDLAGDVFELTDAPKRPDDLTPIEQIVTPAMLANLDLWSYPIYEDIVEETAFSPEVWGVAIGEVFPPPIGFDSWVNAPDMPTPNPWSDTFPSEAAAFAAGDAFRSLHADVLIHQTPSIGKLIGELDIVAGSTGPVGFASTTKTNGLLTFLNLRRLAGSAPTFVFRVKVDGPPAFSGAVAQGAAYEILFGTSLGKNFEANSENDPQFTSTPIDLEQVEVAHPGEIAVLNTEFLITVNMATLAFTAVRTDTAP